jgi:hypothetical protein
VQGTLELRKDGWLQVTAGNPGCPIPLELIEHVRFPASLRLPGNTNPGHQARLSGEQQITGEFLDLDTQKLRLRTGWNCELSVPRSYLVGLLRPSGQLTVLSRNVDNRLEWWKRSPGPPDRDEVWLASGDQVFGHLLRADRREIRMHSPQGQLSFSWAEARGLFPQRPSGPGGVTDGPHVRLVLDSARGNEPDELVGVLSRLDRRSLTLRHPALGEVDVPRAYLLRLCPLFHGRRIELDTGSSCLGERHQGAAADRAVRSEVCYKYALDAQPREARLILTVLRRSGPGGHMEVLVNDRLVADLDRRLGKASGPQRLAVSLPCDMLRVGTNSLRVRRTQGQPGREGFGPVVCDVVVEAVQ